MRKENNSVNGSAYRKLLGKKLADVVCPAPVTLRQKIAQDKEYFENKMRVYEERVSFTKRMIEKFLSDKLYDKVANSKEFMEYVEAVRRKEKEK